MICYSFENGLHLLPAPPETGRGVLAVLTPQETHTAALPARLSVPTAPADPHESQFCWLHIDRTGVTGHLRTPPRSISLPAVWASHGRAEVWRWWTTTRRQRTAPPA